MSPYPEGVGFDQPERVLTPFERQQRSDLERWVDHDERVAYGLRQILMETCHRIRQLPETVSEPNAEYTLKEILLLLKEMMPEPEFERRQARIREEIKQIKGIE
jgi:hypothetical protein